MSKASGVTVFLPDAHFPYQDDEALAAALEVCRRLKPSRLIFTEWLDFQTLSKFPDKPRDHKHYRLQPAVDSCREWLQRFWGHATKSADLIYLEGNHEYRLDKLKSKYPELDGLDALSVPALLRHGADTRTKRRLADFKFLKYGDYLNLEGLIVTHGEIIRKQPGASARAMLEKYGRSVLMGHTHRLAMTHLTTLAGTIWGYEAGCLCNLKQPYVTGVADWAQGLAIVLPGPSVRLMSLGSGVGAP